MKQRTREIGIRLELGAKHAKIAQLILGWVSRRVFAGLLLGVAAGCRRRAVYFESALRHFELEPDGLEHRLSRGTPRRGAIADDQG